MNAAMPSSLYVPHAYSTLSVGGRVRIRYERVTEEIVAMVLEDQNGARIRVPLYLAALRKNARIAHEYATGTGAHHVAGLEA